MNINNFEGFDGSLIWTTHIVLVGNCWHINLMVPCRKPSIIDGPVAEPDWSDSDFTNINWSNKIKRGFWFVWLGIFNTNNHSGDQYPLLLEFSTITTRLGDGRKRITVRTPPGGYPGIPSTLLIDSLGTVVPELDFPIRESDPSRTEAKIILIDPGWKSYGWKSVNPIVGLQFLEGVFFGLPSKKQKFWEYLEKNKK